MRQALPWPQMTLPLRATAQASGTTRLKGPVSHSFRTPWEPQVLHTRIPHRDLLACWDGELTTSLGSPFFPGGVLMVRKERSRTVLGPQGIWRRQADPPDLFPPDQVASLRLSALCTTPVGACLWTGVICRLLPGLRETQQTLPSLASKTTLLLTKPSASVSDGAITLLSPAQGALVIQRATEDEAGATPCPWGN